MSNVSVVSVSAPSDTSSKRMSFAVTNSARLPSASRGSMQMTFCLRASGLLEDDPEKFATSPLNEYLRQCPMLGMFAATFGERFAFKGPDGAIHLMNNYGEKSLIVFYAFSNETALYTALSHFDTICKSSPDRADELCYGDFGVYMVDIAALWGFDDSQDCAEFRGTMHPDALGLLTDACICIQDVEMHIEAMQNLVIARMTQL